MASVLQLSKVLTSAPVVGWVAGVGLRNYRGPEDIDPWLRLREQAFAREKVGVRRWDVSDFRREILEKPWWSPQRMWLAEGAGQAIGAVMLARRGSGPESRPVVHWLMVSPGWRRRGVGRLLIAAAERACWEAGGREIWLETHVQWTAAVAFYTALGYRSG